MFPDPCVLCLVPSLFTPPRRMLFFWPLPHVYPFLSKPITDRVLLSYLTHFSLGFFRGFMPICSLVAFHGAACGAECSRFSLREETRATFLAGKTFHVRAVMIHPNSSQGVPLQTSFGIFFISMSWKSNSFKSRSHLYAL